MLKLMRNTFGRIIYHNNRRTVSPFRKMKRYTLISAVQFQSRKVWLFALAAIGTTILFLYHLKPKINTLSIDFIDNSDQNIQNNLLLSIDENRTDILYRIKNSQYGKCFATKNESFPETDSILEIIIWPNGCTNGQKMLLIVKSSTERSSLRWALRRTWAQNLDFYGSTIKRIFLMGLQPQTTADSIKKNSLLKDESTKYDDILLFNFQDTYKSGGQKVISALKFIETHCSEVSYIVFADDDSIIVPWNVWPFLMQSDFTGVASAGFYETGSKPNRDPKQRHFVSIEEFLCPVFPPFSPGMLYAFSGSSLPLINKFLRVFKPFYLEDVLLGAILQMINATWYRMPNDAHFYTCHGLIQNSHDGSNSASRMTNFMACHSVERAIDQESIWREFCSLPLKSVEAVAINKAYCKNLI